MLAMTMGLASCGSEKDDEPNPGTGGDDGTVEVSISTGTIETKANVMTEFTGNDKMNVFAKTYNRVDAPNIVDNVVASFDGTKWTMSPAVKISKGQNAFVYAVAPYDASYTDATKIPVVLSKQVDLLYSGSFVPASFTSPAIKLNMKHALALATFNISAENYSGAGNLTSLAIAGDIVYTSGTMDVSTGKITPGGKDPFTVSMNKTVKKGGWTEDLPGIWSIPFNTKAGDAQLTAVIDGKSYVVEMPEVEMKTGWQYTFRMVLTNSGLEFDPTKTESRSLNNDDDEQMTFDNYGMISVTSSGSTFRTPVMTGDGVFGSVCHNGNSLSYEPGAVIEGLSGNTTITIETWNSTGFELDGLDGVDVIDLSGY